ncbi:glycosyltransferase family 39 protein [Paracrocinitomix mangrovi]|uniref:ArnT family glycosyltransferase n=1 Tax=Paracrocinitomix mangrovi TaxID=2862509 RepID=UPI001C8DF489|nr:glycosyltransferase family 39 protein [Paracrocinitomix mangrovi]UKN00697.1 glycosyltransferase family 39 protein [Paracrocinitomix mangrovi]
MRTFFKEISESKDFRILIILAVVAFVPTLGIVHLFDWDEINFAESAREMMVTGDYFKVQVNFTPFWEKPPLFFWLQAGSMHLFGINEFAARFPNAIAGIITIAVLYFIGKKEKNQRFGLIWGYLYMCSFLPQMYFRSGIIDPVFNLFIFLSSYYLFKGLMVADKKQKHALLAGLFCGLAVLTKGPVGFLLVLLTFIIFIALKKFKVFPSFKQIGIFALMVVMVSFLWFGFEMVKNGPWFLIEFIEYQIDLFSRPVAGHSQPFYYHFVVVLIGTFPLSIFAIPSLIKRKRETDLERWWTILFWVVLILFSIVETKIIHYSSMTYLPLSFLAATVIEKFNWKELKKYVRIIYLFFAVIFTAIFVGLPLFAVFRHHFLDKMKDPFAVEGFKNPDVVWSGFEPIIVVFYIVGVVLLILYWRKDQLLKGLQWNALLFTVTLSLTTVFVVRKIEAHSQGPMIDFMEEIKGQEVYVACVGFKSYAQYFYFQQPQHPNAFTKIRDEVFDGKPTLYTPLEAEVRPFLKYGDIDYDTYFITKVQHVELDTIPHIKKIDQKGGFKFYKREAVK